MKVTNCLYCGNRELIYVTHRSDNNGILRCAKCGIMMVENISDDTELLYTADYFEKQEGTKSGYTNYLSSPVANIIGKYAFTRLFAKKPGKHLDLGCADGSLIEIFGSEGFASRGLEISKDAVEVANTKGLNVIFSNLASFPKELEKSDVITAFDLLEHADKPRVVLQESYKNLEEDGYFVFSTLSVKKDDPTDYWYNNSLEHYIYYNKENLTYALTEIFGKDRFAFVEIEINGIAEFWGFAKKGLVTSESNIVNRIAMGEFDKKDAESGYMVSLFYNQLAKFTDSEKIIRHFLPVWKTNKAIQAKFYNHYFQGKFEAAINDSHENRHLLSAQNSIYWQALSHAEEELFAIKEKDLVTQHNQEIIELRGQIFKLRDELNSLLNSRVIGRIIKIREFVGTIIPRLKRLPYRLLRKFKHLSSKVLPESIKKLLRLIRSMLIDAKTTYRQRRTTTKIVANKAWGSVKPLVSVVIPYYNHGATITDTINSLKAQTFKNFEVIIVDDGSDKSQAELLDNISENNIQIIHHNGNLGKGSPAAARNTGIKNARGKYVLCLDSDDLLDPTFIEKSTIVLETTPSVSLITTHSDHFGVLNEKYINSPYDPLHLYSNNMVITAAEFKREAWLTTSGYKTGIGYEDWEFWMSLAEKGFWGKLIPEALFKYRVALQSRYIEDKDIHWRHLKTIHSLHPKYKKNIKKLAAKRQYQKLYIDTPTAFINMADSKAFHIPHDGKPNILITIPWMVFGGAETLIYNYCREVKDKFNITFATGLQAEHEWEYKFKEITPNIYHLANLFDDKALYLEFLSNYIKTRNIEILHIIHNGFTFEMLPELKKRHPGLKIAVTMFNDRVAYFEQSVGFDKYIDAYVTDNKKVASHYSKKVKVGKPVTVIPNGINCYDEFSPHLFNQDKERTSLGINPEDLAIFFIGRLSGEKNPDVFLKVAKNILKKNKSHNAKFFIIGDGPMRGVIEENIASINQKEIKYLGYQSEVAKYLSAADIFVLPSSIEGFPLSILEAMSMRVAVVASDVGAVSDVIEPKKDGFIVSAGSEKEIIEKILELNEDRSLLNSVKVNARAKLEKKYSNLALGENYTNMYNELLK